MPYGRLWLLALPPDMGKRALVFAGALAFGIWRIHVGQPMDRRRQFAHQLPDHRDFLPQCEWRNRNIDHRRSEQ